MSSPPISPKILKGALIGIDPFNPVASAVTLNFKMNAEKLTRTLTVQAAGAQGSGFSEALRLKGPPVETYKFELILDATDKLAAGDETVGKYGIHRQLAALEMLVYPKSLLIATNTALLLAGTLEILPPTGPLIFFVWGRRRILPVRITEFSIVEDAFDPYLNPIRATVTMTVRVLSYNDLPVLHPGYGVFLGHQIAKEIMATAESVGTLGDIFGGDIKLF